MFWARRDRRLMIRTWSILENIESGAGRAASSSGLPARFFACLNRTDTTQRLIHVIATALRSSSLSSLQVSVVVF